MLKCARLSSATGWREALLCPVKRHEPILMPLGIALGDKAIDEFLKIAAALPPAYPAKSPHSRRQKADKGQGLVGRHLLEPIDAANGLVPIAVADMNLGRNPVVPDAIMPHAAPREDLLSLREGRGANRRIPGRLGKNREGVGAGEAHANLAGNGDRVQRKAQGSALFSLRQEIFGLLDQNISTHNAVRRARGHG